MAPRNGFIVRNAEQAGANLDLAEPDALDFSLLGNTRYGVLRGCNLSITGWNVSVTPGLVVNNGAVLAVGGQVTLSTPGQTPRFDLIGVGQSGGTPIKIEGLPSPNPVFPDFGENVVILAAVMVRPGIAPPAITDLTDKRSFVPERFVTALDSGKLLTSHDPTTLVEKFNIDHQGTLSWGASRLYGFGPGAPSTVRIEDNLQVARELTVQRAAIIEGRMFVAGHFSSMNYASGDGPPSGAVEPGSVYQSLGATNGVWIYEAELGWQKLSTTTIPAGMIMPSMLSSEPTGWLFLNGQEVNETRAGGLWETFLQWRITTPSGERLRLPNYTGTFLRQGSPGQTGGSGTLTLTEANLPTHRHLSPPSDDYTAQGWPSSGPVQPAGSHSHFATIFRAGEHSHDTAQDFLTGPTPSGAHGHVVNDPGHIHAGADGGGGGAFITMVWGGRRRIDGPFNDASHPVAVQEVLNTVRAHTGISVGSGGEHSHPINRARDHGHEITIEAKGSDHVHIMNERTVGSSQPINLQPPYGTVNYLIKN